MASPGRAFLTGVDLDERIERRKVKKSREELLQLLDLPQEAPETPREQPVLALGLPNVGETVDELEELRRMIRKTQRRMDAQQGRFDQFRSELSAARHGG